MRNILAISFVALMLISIAVWIVGLLTAAIFPWFGGIRADRIGEAGFTVGLIGEGCTYIFGWLWMRLSQKRRKQVMGLPGPKRYGHKKDVA